MCHYPWLNIFVLIGEYDSFTFSVITNKLRLTCALLIRELFMYITMSFILLYHITAFFHVKYAFSSIESQLTYFCYIILFSK